MTEDTDELEEYQAPDLNVICHGHPKCTFSVYEAKRCLSNGGCRWCIKVWIDKNGEKFVEAPGHA